MSIAGIVMTAAGPGWASDAAPVFKIYIEHSGVYQIPYERLDEAGLEGPAGVATLGLRNRGEPVPIWIEDGGDGIFGPGDRVVFLGETLRGDHSYLDPYSRFNCYVLDFGDPEPRRGSSRVSAGDPNRESSVLLAQHHLESDLVMVRFPARREAPEEEWYWARLSVADKEAFVQQVILDGLVVDGERRPAGPASADEISEAVRRAGEERGASAEYLRSRLVSTFASPEADSARVRVRLGLRGWSEPRHRERDSLPHHEIEIRLNGEVVGRSNWNGKDHHVHDLAIAPNLFLAGANEISFRVPKRRYPESGDLVVDVSLLNWIELEYAHEPRVADEQARLRLADPGAGRFVRIHGLGKDLIELYLPEGIRVVGDDGSVAADLTGLGDEFAVLGSDAAAAPDEIVPDRPSNLASGDRQADYIMITHRRLQSGTERLAEFHRQRGLAVAVVDVQDIYDEFNHGIVSPKAIRDFLAVARANWRGPAPRFLLLVGDASWDFKNATADDSNYADWTYRPGENRMFVKNRSTAYAEEVGPNHRNLVPTSNYPTTQGHAASDAWFVTFDDGDTMPDMAVGRLPVVSPEELDGIVDKTIAFISEPPVGPWKRNLLFIANENEGFQRRSDHIADEYGRLGFAPAKIYPHPSEPANEHHTRRIVEMLDGGVFAVHFLGHGGRYIWRTGPPDLEKNHDLFTLDHLESLAESDRLPVVLSLTCYSAPFDHPTADSIGEKLVRIPGRGAVAVFAASWRNSPSPGMGKVLLDELTAPGTTVGEAVMRAKRGFRSEILIQTYNLLGDPAVPTGAPPRNLGLSLGTSRDGLRLDIEAPAGIGTGDFVAEWIATDGSVLREDRGRIVGADFSISAARAVVDESERLLGVRVYLWDESSRLDGIGWVGSTPPDVTRESIVAARPAGGEPVR